MSIEQTLMKRANACCELCGSASSPSAFDVPASPEVSSDCSLLLCDTCKPQIEGTIDLEGNHWRCLNDSMWSQEAAVQVMAWRTLKGLIAAGELWAQDMLDMMYLEEATQKWAEAGIVEEREATRDSNGAILVAGDNVVLIKDLVVKGAGFTAKRGTAVRGISLTDNPEHIEGRVNGTRIVLITQYLKKS